MQARSQQQTENTSMQTTKAESSSAVAVPKAVRHVLLQIVNNYCDAVAIDCWGQEYITGLRRPPVLTLHFRHPGVLRNVLIFRDRFFLTECWLNGLFEFDGTMDKMLDFAEYLSTYQAPASLAIKVLAGALGLPALTMPNLREAAKAGPDPHTGSTANDIQHHYDVGNDFYQLILDPLMVYSCAYFHAEETTLAQAQEAKLDLICRKLLLKPGERLLDVGCGWGALLRWAAKNYGVTAHGITLSQSQYEYAKQRAQAEGLSDRVHVHVLDYHHIPSDWKFHKIASVGMIEHVGVKHYPEYFSALRDCLLADGLFLCHGITTASASGVANLSSKFVRRYIFPGGELGRLSQVIESARAYGFETVDVDGWRPHYTRTLGCWARRLEGNWQQAVELAGERITKLWLLYMTASARGFMNNYLRIYQVLLRKEQDAVWNLPMTRNSWLA